MEQRRIGTIALLVVLNLAVGLADLAPALKACKRNDPVLDKCIEKVVDEIRPNIASGDYGGDRIAPSLDPFFIDKMDIDHGPSFKASLRNVTIEGITKFVIRRIRPDIPNKRFLIGVKMPYLVARGKYDLNMNILLLKLTGKGDFNLTQEDTLGNIKVQYDLEPGKDGKEYVKFRPVDVKLKFDKAQFYLKNLFNGDPTLERVGNDAINANPHILLDEVKVPIEEELRKRLTDISNTIIKGATEEDMLPLS